MDLNRKKSFTVVSLIVLFTASLNGGCQWVTQGRQQKDPKPVAQAPVVVDGTRTSYADIVEKTSPAVVQITADLDTKKASREDGGFGGLPFPMEEGPRIGAGSGVIVSADGTILTNHHVIENARKITVETSENKTYEATVVGSDAPSDLAVIKIKGDAFPFLKLGDSDAVRVGDIVLAIGNPLGIGKTVTAGIISAKGRRTGLGDGAYQDFLQTDAPINQGNSGGALVSVGGELVGINSQILSNGGGGGSIGIGFAIPSNMAKVVMEQLIKDGKVRRGILGVNIQEVTTDIAEQFGVEAGGGAIVSNVREGSAAEKAGLKRGDIITEIDGKNVEDGNFLRNRVASTAPGTKVELTIIRDKKTQKVSVTLDELTDEVANAGSAPTENGEEKEPQNDSKLGVSVQPVTPDLAARYKIPASVKGLVITEMDRNGAAARSGVQPGDVIMEVNRIPVESTDDMRSALGKAGNGAVVLLINRAGTTVYVSIRQ
ncbi:MAG: Do family serine endopeptidase [Pyrinomonadaceae bacterium]